MFGVGGTSPLPQTIWTLVTSLKGHTNDGLQAGCSYPSLDPRSMLGRLARGMLHLHCLALLGAPALHGGTVTGESAGAVVSLFFSCSLSE